MKIWMLASVLALAAGSRAAVIYDTFGSGNAYDNSVGWSVNSGQSIATPFTVPSAGILTSVELALHPSETDYTISLTQGGATAPGTMLYTWTFTPDLNNTTIYSLFPTGAVNLPAGDYYIVAENAGDWGAWSWNSVGHAGSFSVNGGSGWFSINQTTSVMRIDVAPVPEPASLAALGLGGAAFLRRRKKA